MKSMKKLIPALCLLLVSAVLMGTSTYAWFSMNATVSAKLMQVTAKSDNIDLLIGTSSDITTLQADNKTTVSFTTSGTDVEVYPAAYFKSDGSLPTPPTGSTNVINQNTAKEPANWYYRVADSASASTSTKTPTVLTSFDDYVLKYDLYITMAKGSKDATDLVINSSSFTTNNTSTTADATRQAVRALVASDSGVVELSPANTSSTVKLATTVTDSAVIKLTVYVFYDGNDSTVYTNNIANLDGAKIDIYFAVSPTAAP